MAFYLDTSAAVKLVQQEHGSAALLAWMSAGERVLVSSLLLHTELLRATRRSRPDLLAQARALLEHVTLIDVGWREFWRHPMASYACRFCGVARP